MIQEIDHKQITKDQHFVPRFYMKKFAEENNFLQVLDILNAKILKPRPYPGVCYEKFYYAVKTGVQDEVSQHLEDLFSTLENDIAKEYDNIYKKIISYQPLNSSERYTIAIFASLLWLRGEYMRKQINRSTEDMTKQMNAMRAGHPGFPEFVRQTLKKKGKDITDEEIENIRKEWVDGSYSLEFNNVIHLSLIAETYANFANMFYGQNWRIYIAQGSKEFITSDFPLLEVFPERTTFYGASFLERKHYITLSPTVLVEMVYPISGKTLKRKVIGDTEVTDFNLMRVNNSGDYCYSRKPDELKDLIVIREENHRQLFNSIIKRASI